ncbi:MAG: hypothetical protein U5L72_19195 [Bacteroidales bacterium]|nr:hypothetical protein [Bacteroidales bacterium]
MWGSHPQQISHGLPGRTGYSAVKVRLHGFLETLRIENLKEKLHVMNHRTGFYDIRDKQNALTADGSPPG